MKLTIAIPRRLIEKLLRRMIPLAEEVSDLFQQNAEEDGLTPKLRGWIERYQVKSWGAFYEDSDNYFGLHAGALAIQDQPLPQFTISPSLSEREILDSWFDQLWQYIDQLLDDDSDDLRRSRFFGQSAKLRLTG